MKRHLRRLIFGDRRKTDRVVNDTKEALRRLDRALSTVELAAAEHDDQRRRANER